MFQLQPTANSTTFEVDPSFNFYLADGMLAKTNQDINLYKIGGKVYIYTAMGGLKLSSTLTGTSNETSLVTETTLTELKKTNVKIVLGSPEHPSYQHTIAYQYNGSEKQTDSNKNLHIFNFDTTKVEVTFITYYAPASMTLSEEDLWNNILNPYYNAPAEDIPENFSINILNVQRIEE